MHEWSDATTGEVTLRVVAAMAFFIVLLVLLVLVYATSWGYAVHF
jgi:hypothetical protein